MSRALLVTIACLAASVAPVQAQQAPKADPAKGDPAKGDPAKADPANDDPAKADPAKADAPQPPQKEDVAAPTELDGSLTGATPPRAAIPVGDDLRAPRRLLEFRVEGRVRPSDTVEIVHGLIEQAMPIGGLWQDDDQRTVTEHCLRIGYYVGFRDEPIGQAGTRAVLNLEPVPLVRHVNVRLKNRSGMVTGFIDGILEDRLFEKDIQRHMQLRPGSPLPLDVSARESLLAGEKDRVFDYLKDEGYFEAQVDVVTADDGPFAVKLDVTIATGPAYQVGEIRVSGNTEVADQEVIALFHHDRLWVWKRRFSLGQLKKDIDGVYELYKRRGFPGVRVNTDYGRGSYNRANKTVEFTVIVRERRRVEVYFEGVNGVSELDLRDQLTLDTEGSYDDFEVERSAQAIRRYYQSKGYFEATAVWERVSFRLPTQLFDRIVFTIDEGPKLKIRKVEFAGNSALSNVRLRDLIKTREFPRFGFLISGGYTTSIQLEQDAERIREAYQRLGYSQVQVEYEVTRSNKLIGNAPALAAAIVSDLPATGLYVRFRVIEGPRQAVARVEVSFEGPHSKQAAELLQQTRLRQRSAFTTEASNDDSQRIKRYYFERGFPHAKVSTATHLRCDGQWNAVEFQCDGVEIRDQVIITHTVREGTFTRIGKVALRGNFKTRDWVLHEQIGVAEGRAFTLGSAESAQRNLRTSGLFSAVRFDYIGLEEDAPKDIVNVVVHVQERYDHWLSYEAGFGRSSDDGWFLSSGLRFPNLLGIGMSFNLTGRLGFENLSLSPSDPALGLGDRDLRGKLVLPPWIQQHYVGLGFRTELEGSWQIEQHERFGELESQGVSVAVQREGRIGGKWEGWLLSLRYDFHRINRNQDLVRPPGPADDTDQVPIQTLTGAVGPVLVIDKRRDAQGRLNPLAPIKGFSLTFSALFADRALGGNDRFVKLGFKAQHYWKPGKRLLVTNGLRHDHGIPLGGAVLLPEVERYFAGGDSTVRGFEEDRLLTELVEDDVPPIGGVTQFRSLPAGGNLRFLYNIDLQMTVWDDAPGLPWASALFLDSGLVAYSLDDFEVSSVRHSLGIAFLRLVSPFGAFSLEWAIPLDPQRGDNPRGRFHFNLGFVFK